jgi:uncharacterized protein (TIGR02145 family)
MKNLSFLFVFMFMSIMTFGQDTTATVTDIDGNIYHTVKIGNQTWMVEDLKVTTYNNGVPIQNITGNEIGKLSWYNDYSGAYCWYNNNIVSKNTFGALYNWTAVSKGVLAPKGWHIPTIEEWKVLIEFLGGEKIAGGKLKEAGTIHWTTPNTGADNSSGFTALPGGGRMDPYDFLAAGTKGWWWSSSKKGLIKSYYIGISYKLAEVGISTINTNTGFSVRCIKD